LSVEGDWTTGSATDGVACSRFHRSVLHRGEEALLGRRATLERGGAVRGLCARLTTPARTGRTDLPRALEVEIAGSGLRRLAGAAHADQGAGALGIRGAGGAALAEADQAAGAVVVVRALESWIRRLLSPLVLVLVVVIAPGGGVAQSPRDEGGHERTAAQEPGEGAARCAPLLNTAERARECIERSVIHLILLVSYGAPFGGPVSDVPGHAPIIPSRAA
jgi:hypothetical protein